MLVGPIPQVSRRDRRNLLHRAKGKLQATLQSDQTESRKDTEHHGQYVRCFAKFTCTRCNRWFNKNTLYPEKVAGKFVDPRTMAAPWEQCSECNSECDVEETSLRPFDRTDPSQLSIHDHSPENCAECIKAGTWCKQAQRLSKRSPQQYDKALRNYLEKTSTSSSPWKTFGQEGVNDGGLEKVIVENNIAFTIQLFPLKFLFPTGNPFAHSLSLSNTRTQCLSLFFPLSFSLLFSPFHYSFPDSLSHTLTFSSLSLSLVRSL